MNFRFTIQVWYDSIWWKLIVNCKQYQFAIPCFIGNSKGKWKNDTNWRSKNHNQLRGSCTKPNTTWERISLFSIFYSQYNFYCKRWNFVLKKLFFYHCNRFLEDIIKKNNGENSYHWTQKWVRDPLKIICSFHIKKSRIHFSNHTI